jgi:hypothetical protein
MKSYKAKVRFIFEGEVYVNSDSKENVKEIVEKQFYMTTDGFGYDNEDIKDWNFNVHAEKKILKINLG